MRSPPQWASPNLKLDVLIGKLQTDLRKPALPVPGEEEETDDRGNLQECLVETIRITTTCSGLYIAIVYEKAIHKFFLSGSTQVNTSLMFANAPTSVMQRMFEILSEALDAPLAMPFKRFQLPSSFIQKQMEAYLKALGAAEPSNTLSIVEAVLRHISVGVTFEAPIAPTLRSLNIELLPETVRTISLACREDTDFLNILAEHLKSQTGLTLTSAIATSK